ncbi:MAG: arabinosyltransferase C-terminal domain-containing protein, partial [Tomitella sp.]|nr:arabinosyltransferase C-terminal domain-containing protein [Tomitella sp.]
DGRNGDRGVGGARARALQQRVRNLPGGSPLAISAGALVALEVASLAVGFAVQYPAYSVGLANVRSLAGDPCNLAYDVLVEPDANATMLQPAEPTDNPLGAVRQVNFSPNGLPVDVSYQRDDNGALVGNPDEPPDANSPGTGGGLLPEPGVNGSRMALPFGLDPATTPVLGSYMPEDPEAVADATSAWYALPPRGDRGDVLAIAAAGEVKRENLEVEFGRSSGDGYEVVGSSGLEDVGPAPSWRSLRLPKSSIPDEAQVVRIVAHDDEPDPDDWIAFTPPRMPRLQTLQQYLGTDTPVLEDWPVPLTMTCQHQVDYNHGVAEVPDYRIQAEQGLAVVATNWEGAQGGGPLGWAELLLTAESMPTYLDHDWDRQWGALIRYAPRVPDAVPAQLELGQERRSGWWTPGPIRY